MNTLASASEEGTSPHRIPSKLSWVEVDIFRGHSVSLDRSEYCLWNPWVSPGDFSFCFSASTRESIGSQVASRLAMQHFFQGVSEAAGNVSADVSAKQVIQSGFSQANNSVYTFGHSMAAGGMVSAALLGFCVREGGAAAGRVGAGQVYLLRNGEMVPLFEEVSPLDNDQLVGSRPKVSVEVGSLEVKASDRFILCPREFSFREKREAEELARDILIEPRMKSAAEVAGFLFEKPKEVPFFALVEIGPETHFLC